MLPQVCYLCSVLSLWDICSVLVVSTSVVDCLERPVSKMTWGYMMSGTQLTAAAVYTFSDNVMEDELSAG